MRILHVTPHLGGGVGSVICAWIKNDVKENYHIVISLDNNINKDNFAVLANVDNCSVYESVWNKNDYNDFVNQELCESDVIILHWWNHPLTFDFIYNVKLQPCRLIVWCHTACTCPPNVLTEDVVNYADKVVFTSPVSYHSKDVKRLVRKYPEKFELIWSTSGVDEFLALKKQTHDGFVVGYIGTADFSKLNKNFIKMCSKIKNKNVRFEVYTIDSQDELKKQAENLGISNRFVFGGKVPHDKIPEILSRFDVLGYPLQKKHYGTCEQALGEAMAAGVVPVCLNNACEHNIIENGINGFLCGSEKKYIEIINSLLCDDEKLNYLSEQARKRAEELYSVKKMICKWNIIISNMLMMKEKSLHLVNEIGTQVLPHELYIMSLGKYGKLFVKLLNGKNKLLRRFAGIQIKHLYKMNPAFNSNSKGSPKQYYSFFKNSLELFDLNMIADKS